MYTIANINEIVNGKAKLYDANSTIKHLSIDSRTIHFPEESIFIALQDTRDGHDFITAAYDKGIRNFIVGKPIKKDDLPKANIITVTHTKAALKQLAAHHRNQFGIEVIGITGSNGKTIVKEWLNQLLQSEHNIVRNPKSYNSQIGVPLSVWNILPQHTLAIFEAGISQPNEMETLANIIQPTIGIFTNIGSAHNEGFNGDVEKKIVEKIQLFKQAKLVVYCSNNALVDTTIKENLTQCQLLQWGSGKHNAIVVNKQISKGNQTTIQLTYKKNKITIKLPFVDAASIENAMHCVALMLYKQYSEKQINLRIQQLQTVALRLEQKKGINNCLLINDSYSNDLSSLPIALDSLQQWSGKRSTCLVLTDMEQSGIDNETLYQKVATIIKDRKISHLLGIGEQLYQYQTLFSFCKNALFFVSTGEAKKYVTHQKFEQQAILFKGARKFELEQLVFLLEEKVHQTVLEVDLNKLQENIKAHQALVPPTTKIMAIVKAFGYGNGSIEVAQVLQKAGVQYLAVAYTDEGVTLRKAGIYLPIMVMNTEPQAYDALVAYNLEPELFSINNIQDFLQYAQRNALSNYPIHIKLDTGMHRLGFEPKEIKTLGQILQQQNLVKVQSIFSHLVGSDAARFDAFTKEQNALFVDMATALETMLQYKTIWHIANTGAMQRHKNLQHNMVRLGIGMYGVSANKKLKLQPVATLKATIAQIKNIPKGETVGYNRNGVAKKPMRIATIRIGYADGYSRNLGNGNSNVLINGQLAPTIGNICMDMTMIDITHIPNVQEGDYVTLFGAKPTIEEVAKWSSTIAYEILTNVNERVKRVYIEQ